MASNFAFEFTSTEKTPEGVETKKSLKMGWAVVALVIVAALVGAGAIDPADIASFFRDLPGGLLK